MAKIFDIQDWLKNHPDRNNFDLTHKVHGSYRFGIWYPFLCKPVVPGDSFHVETAVSTRFMPMPFPTQSNMRLVFHYHYVRTKNIWKNFENWLMGLEEHTPPYLNLPHTYYRNGSLADYLGVQTSFHQGSYVYPTQLSLGHIDARNTSSIPTCYPVFYERDGGKFEPVGGYDELQSGRTYFMRYYADGFSLGNGLPERIELSNFSSDTTHYDTLPNNTPFVFAVMDDLSVPLTVTSVSMSGGTYILNIKQVDDFIKGRYSIVLYFPVKSGSAAAFVPDLSPNIYNPYIFTNVRLINAPFAAVSGEVGTSDVSKCPYQCSDTPSDDSNVVRVSALPFRAYESVCRAYYRNTQGVQPFVVDGVTKYNQWNTTVEDGADDTEYTLFKRNWELDAYTSCLLSPQQTPVFVGMTNVSSLGRMSVQSPDGVTAEVRLSDGDNEKSVEYSNLEAATPEARRFALNVASLGFTIPEFREANSLQRWLELNLRKGYRYKDFIEGHFGKSPKYNELDMPEFLGGFTQRVSVNDISNTNGGTDASDISGSLGAIAGQARAIGGSKHGVNSYFDDFGFIVGVFSIVPDTAYDCLLPKHFNLKEPLDFYFPEFSQTSFQEITYEELAPVQRKVNRHDLASTFGYQRPNHDLVWYPDTVHGRFRDASGIGNSVICRRFADAPVLASEFLEIDPASTDTIFSYTLGNEDICLGEIVVGITAKRPIPRLFNPSIS